MVAAGYNLDGALTRLQTDLDDYEDEVDRLTAAYEENQSGPGRYGAANRKRTAEQRDDELLAY